MAENTENKNNLEQAQQSEPVQQAEAASEEMREEQTAAAPDQTGIESVADSAVTDVASASEAETDVVAPPVYTKPEKNPFQAVVGILCGGAIWGSIGLGAYLFETTGNTLFSWLFVIAFAAIMFTKRFLEAKKEKDLRVFMKFFLIGLIIFLGIYLIFGIATGALTFPAG